MTTVVNVVLSYACQLIMHAEEMEIKGLHYVVLQFRASEPKYYSVIRKNERSDSYFSWTNSSPVCFYFAEGVYVLMVTIYA